MAPPPFVIPKGAEQSSLRRTNYRDAPRRGGAVSAARSAAPSDGELEWRGREIARAKERAAMPRSNL